MPCILTSIICSTVHMAVCASCTTSRRDTSMNCTQQASNIVIELEPVLQTLEGESCHTDQWTHTWKHARLPDVADSPSNCKDCFACRPKQRSSQACKHVQNRREGKDLGVKDAHTHRWAYLQPFGLTRTKGDAATCQERGAEEEFTRACRLRLNCALSSFPPRWYASLLLAARSLKLTSTSRPLLIPKGWAFG